MKLNSWIKNNNNNSCTNINEIKYIISSVTQSLIL